MQLLQLLIIQVLLLLTSSLLIAAATGNSNVETKLEDVNIKNAREKRSLGLAILFSSLLQNSAPPQPTAKMPMTTTPPPQYLYNPGFGYQPNLPYLPDKSGYINFNVPDGYVLVTPPPTTTQPPPPPTLPLKLQKKQSFLNFLATLSAGAPPPAPTTTTKAPPQAILIPKSLFPTYQQQQRVIYKYAQNDDTSSDVLESNHDVAPQYTYTATHAAAEQPASTPDASYYQEEEEGPGPVDSSYYKTSHHAYEQSPVYSSTTPDRFRITYPDDNDNYQPTSSETRQYEPPQEKHASQSEHGYSASYGY